MAPSELISFWLPYQCICYMLWEFFSIIKKPHMISTTKALAFMSAAVKVWAETKLKITLYLYYTVLLTRSSASATV